MYPPPRGDPGNCVNDNHCVIHRLSDTHEGSWQIRYHEVMSNDMTSEGTSSSDLGILWLATMVHIDIIILNGGDKRQCVHIYTTMCSALPACPLQPMSSRYV